MSEATRTGIAGALGIRLWKGEDISEKTILAWSDQGLGDTIQMARYFPQIKARRLILYVEAPLFNLMRCSFASDTVEIRLKGWAFSRTDYHVPLTSLMAIFKAAPGAIPQGRYLGPPSRSFALGSRRPLIGINWQGNSTFTRDGTRSMPLALMEPLFELGTIVSLQKGNAQSQANGYPILDLMDECHDLCDTASLIDQLDCVVTTDTVVPHLAGALAKPTCLLEQWESEWRWGFGPTSPWYDSVHVMCQGKSRDWPSAVEKARQWILDKKAMWS